MDLDNYVQSDADSTNAHTGSNHGMSPSNHDISLTNDDMNDVMKVLTDLDGYDVDTESGDKNLDSLTSVQDVSKVVDKSALADEKYSQAFARQLELERRFTDLTRRINQMRCEKLSVHVTEELTSLRSYCNKVAPSPPPQPAQPPPPIHLPPPPPPSVKMNPFSFQALRPPNMPDGVFLPNVPTPQINPSLPTTPLAPSNLPDIKIKQEIEERKPAPPLTVRERRAPPPSIEEKRKTDEVLGQLDSGLRHLIQTYDSDATESSSGGESCDELEDYPVQISHPNPKDPAKVGSVNVLPIRKRAKYRWLASRSSVASRWTWLTAQISDLEYRIRQQSEFHRQVRANKGLVTLQEPQPPSLRTQIPAPVNSPIITDTHTRFDEDGRRILIKHPLPEPELNPEEYLGSARTRPIRPLRKRQVLSTQNFYRNSTRAAKESTVQCDCVRPHFWCAICFSRSNHVQTPDPISHEPGKIFALLDHSYHQVLSSRNDIPLDIQMSHKMKNRDWLSRSTISKRRPSKSSKKLRLDISGAHMSNKERLEAKRKLKKKLREERREMQELKKRKKMKDADGLLKKKKLKLMRAEKRGKSITVHHHADGTTSAMMDLTTGDPESTSHHQQSTNTLAMAEQIRRKRETAFDIDNIVIPYSMAASVRVEKLKYKEILTPTWRLLEEEQQKTDPDKPPSESESICIKEEEEKEKSPEKLPLVSAAATPVVAPSSALPANQPCMDEELSDTFFEIRHARAEIDERKRWLTPLNKSTGGQRSRSRRQDSRAEASSGCNTPDPMSPGVVVDSLEVATRPSTPVNTEESSYPSSLPTTSMAASIRYRRRTSSATKSRDRNPSEDTQSSRCTTPVIMEPLQEEVAPYEPFNFPLTDEEYNTMLEDMPDGYDIGTPEEGEVCAGLRVVGENLAQSEETGTGNRSSPVVPFSSRSSSLGEDDETEDDPDWCAEDPDDPEWTGKEQSASGPGPANLTVPGTSSGKRRASTSGGFSRSNLS